MPNAVRDAIPDFMAVRGADGITGGPIRLHHDFWEPFLQRVINSLGLSESKRIELAAAIALPIGRVTSMTVDGEGRTIWSGYLSEANPIAKIIWQMLKEGLIHLGVSLGGRIIQVQNGGRDITGKPCTLITKIRIDELSITDNPALRIPDGVDTGAYIMALAKSVLGKPRSSLKPKNTGSVEQFLKKALGDSSGAVFSGSKSDTNLASTGLAKPLVPKNKPKTSSGGGLSSGDGVKTGMNKDNVNPSPGHKQNSKGKGPSTDVWGMSVGNLTKELAKCGDMTKADDWAASVPMFADAHQGLIGLTDNPPPEVLNLIRLLFDIAKHSSEMPTLYKSDKWRAEQTMKAMGQDLKKMASEVAGKIPKELSGKPLRPPGSKSISARAMATPQTYA